jgi:prevent-host-death family protein
MPHERDSCAERSVCRRTPFSIAGIARGTSVTRLVPVEDANTKLTALLHNAERETLVLTRHSHPAAVVISARRYSALLAQIDALDDHISLHEREALIIGLDRLKD